MSHRYHPDPGRDDPPDAKLFDGCERCDEQAQFLVGLDRQNLAWFWSGMDQIKRLGKSPDRDLTENEHLAMNNLYAMAIIFERLSGVWPSPEVLGWVRDIEV